MSSHNDWFIIIGQCPIATSAAYVSLTTRKTYKKKRRGYNMLVPMLNVCVQSAEKRVQMESDLPDLQSKHYDSSTTTTSETPK